MLTPRYYQQQAIDNFFDYTAKNWGKHPIIVLPTGSGKSLVQAVIIKKILSYEHTRVLMLTHQKELIKQNAQEFIENFTNEIFFDVGIYSAGLKKKDTKNRVLFAGIQSVYKKAWHLGWFDIILIDECHLIPHKNEGMYRTFLSEMEKINKNIVVCGLSATPFRTKDGLLTDGENTLFDEICHETTIKELMDPQNYKNLDKKQYLCPIISPKKSMKSKADLSHVHIRGGEYIQQEMENAFIRNDLVSKAVQEILEYTTDRKKILIFASGIKHCEEIKEKMLDLGLNVGVVHSKQSEELNQQNINKFKKGTIKFLINMGILTTGFNEKGIDCIAILRATQSPVLYIQIVGRGMRLHPDKENCLVLDFGQNIERHGPIDKIEIRKKSDGTSEIQTAPEKECPECHSLIHLSIMECPECGFIFIGKNKHEEKASETEIISVWKKPLEVEIKEISYSKHEKQGKIPSLRVDYYYSFFEKYSEWICLDHTGFARKKALQWISNVTEYDIKTVDEALKYCEYFKKPKKIIVDLNDKFPKVVGYSFEDDTKEDDLELKLERLIF